MNRLNHSVPPLRLSDEYALRDSHSCSPESKVVFTPPKSTVQMFPSELANCISAVCPPKNGWNVAIG